MASEYLRRKRKAQDVENKRAQKARAESRFYSVNSILGNTWAVFFGIIGGRMTGKSYSLADFLCIQHKRLKKNVKNYWLRISDTSIKAMLSDKCKYLIDPDLQRKHDLDLTVKGMDVYDHWIKGKRGQEPFITCMPLSSFGKLKGVGFFDKDFKGWYNIVLDEFQLEIGEKRTSFDILYNFIGMIENIARTTKNKIRVFLVGNTLEEASTILKAFNFIPEKFGRFYLKSKRCVIDNLEPTEEYLKDRKGSLADILGGDDMSNYTNALRKDVSLIEKKRTKRPTAIIKFTKTPSDWYTLWDGRIVKKYNNESLNKESDFCMRPYLDSYFSREKKQTIIDMYDSQALKFNSLITQAYFKDALSQVRKQ